MFDTDGRPVPANPAPEQRREPFWQTKSLTDMTNAEWESLCDGCARCCLHKLEEEDTREVVYTSVACHLLDIDQCRCRSYADRSRLVPDCLTLTPETVPDYYWLPKSCAYRRLSEGKDLPWWHPLVSGDPDTVHEAGISLRNKAISETYVDIDDLEPYVIDVEF